MNTSSALKYLVAASGILLSTCLLASAQTQTDPATVIQSQQNQSATLAATWLGSSDARTRAWGAYLALRDRRQELLPQLIALIEAHPVAGGPLKSAEYDDHTATLGVLDAVIQMDGKVPPKEAARLYPEFPVQALVFLANGGPEASSYLLDIFKRENSHTLAWLAAGDLLMNNLLMNLKPSGFAAALVEGFTVHAAIHVVDNGGRPQLGGGELASCPSTLPSHWPSGWPPIASYSFTPWSSGSPTANYTLFSAPNLRDGRVLLVRVEGDTLLAGGVDPSFYNRAVGKTAPYTESPCEFEKPNRDVEREHFLAALAGEAPRDPTVRSSIETAITWENDAQYLRDVRTFIDRQQGLFDKLIGKLVAAGLLSAEESASARPTLQMLISDERSKKAPSLPAVQNTGSNVKFVY